MHARGEKRGQNRDFLSKIGKSACHCYSRSKKQHGPVERPFSERLFVIFGKRYRRWKWPRMWTTSVRGAKDFTGVQTPAMDMDIVKRNVIIMPLSSPISSPASFDHLRGFKRYRCFQRNDLSFGLSLVRSLSICCCTLDDAVLTFALHRGHSHIMNLVRYTVCWIY